MATYYVRTDGDNSNTGTGPATTQAWQTIGKVFASGSVVTGGDIVYIAPGTYTESINVLATSPTSKVQIIGNPTASQFPGVNAGVVKLSAFNAAGTSVTFANTYLISGTSKNYYSFSNMIFEGSHTSSVSVVEFFTSRYIQFDKCVFRTENAPGLSSGGQLRLTATASTPLDASITNCYFGPSSVIGAYLTGASQSTDTTIFSNCYFDAHTDCLPLYFLTASVVNCTFVGQTSAILQAGGGANAFLTIKNCLFKRCGTAIQGTSSVSGAQTYNRFVSCTTDVINIPTSVTSTTTGVFGVDSFESLLFGLNNLQPGTSYDNSPNKSFGNATGAPATDLYGVTWTGTSPDAGSGTYRVITSNPTNIQYNGGVERNASAITIAPGSTSQSVELYLGATGLTFATSGLAAYYVRNRAAPTPITLVAAPNPTWVSGGFAEIDSATVPGLYRLDLPDAALNAGADDVTVVVRGASGTNGAVLTIKLSAGGLTAAQTASAVLDAVASIHNNAGSIGASIQDKAGYSLSTPQSFSTTGSVGSVTGNVAGNVTGTVGGVVGNVVGNITGSVATVATPDNIIDGVWDEQRTGHTAAGSFGEKLQTNALADEMLARDLGSGLNAGTAEERTVRSALRALRNKINVGSSQMVVKKEDDTTDAWTATVTTTAVSSNVSGIDPN